MKTEITKNLMCVKVGDLEIWFEEDKISNIKQILGNKNAEQFIQIGDEIVNRSYITGIFKAKTMENLTRRKNGQWKCRYGFWHNRGEECAHHLFKGKKFDKA